MRFLKLEILNLASLDKNDGEVIDFESGALKDSTIFSIVGPTGSGKSTILDAICLALYNRAPRYPRKKGDRKGIEIYGNPDDQEKNRLAPTDCRNILTRGKKKGYSKLTFLANDGSVYRAEWHVTIPKTKFSNALTTLYKINSANGEQTEEIAEWDNLQQIIGLDYEQFLRTVLIAQGSFANFLTAKENERYELLEKLIGCEDLYSGISFKIKEKKDEAVKAFENINANFTAYEKDIIPDSEYEEVCVKIQRLEEADKAVKTELVKVNEALTWYKALQTIVGNIDKYTSAQNIAAESLNNAGEKISRLSLHDKTLEATGYFKDIKAAEEETVKIKKSLESLSKQIEVAAGEITANEELLAKVKESEKEAAELYEKAKPHINKARSLTAELDLALKSVTEKKAYCKSCGEALEKARKEVKTNAEMIEKGNNELKLYRKRFGELKEEIEKKKEELSATVKRNTESLNDEMLKIEGVNASSLQNAKSAAERKMFDLTEAIRIRKDYRTKLSNLSKNEEQHKLMKQRNLEVEKELGQLPLAALSKEVETLSRTLTLMTSENWETHRHSLTSGIPCPLCGSTEHPYASSEVLLPVINDLESILESKKQELSNLTDRQNNLNKELAENQGKISGIETTNAHLALEIYNLNEQWKTVHQKHVDWSEEEDELSKLSETFVAEVQASCIALEKYNDVTKNIEQLRKAKDAATEELSQYTKAAEEQLRKAETIISQKETAVSTEIGKTDTLKEVETEKMSILETAGQDLKNAEKTVRTKTEEISKEIGEGKTPDEVENQFLAQNKQKSEAVNSQNEKLSLLRENLKALNGQKEATLMSLEKENQKIASGRESLVKWLEEYNAKLTKGSPENDSEHVSEKAPNLNGSSENETATEDGCTVLPKALCIEDIEELYNADDNWEEIRLLKERLQEALTKAATTLNNEKTLLANHLKSKPAKGEEELTQRKAELESQSNEELTNEKARRQRHIEAKKILGDLFTRRQEALTLKNEWEEINEAIGGDGKTLRKIAQCYTLRFLIEHANYEIRRFNSRYELQQVRNSLGIRVIDHDRGDDVRDTTSLSGGETFIVSLGLALGLSALSSRNISFENLFIDEGFGTLDPDTLATVIDSLAMLQSSQGKKVGVISHTDTMAERITTQIRIIKNGNTGSSHIEIHP